MGDRDADEVSALRALEALTEFAVGDPDSDERVLLAEDENGGIGAWDREGARRFAGELDCSQSPVLATIRQDLLLAVSAG